MTGPSCWTVTPPVEVRPPARTWSTSATESDAEHAIVPASGYLLLSYAKSVTTAGRRAAGSLSSGTISPLLS